MTDLIVCNILTGFLGSGKSTLLNAFLRTDAGPRTAVIVNEFGTIGIDQFMFEELAEDVYLLDSGCLCCTVTHSLRETLLDLKSRIEQMDRAPLESVVIETTGLADPLPILHALLGDRALNRHFRLGKVITTVDAVQGLTQLARHSESVRQAAVADRLVVTKTDLASSDDLKSLEAALRDINSRAPIAHSASAAPMTGVFDTALEAADEPASRHSERSEGDRMSGMDACHDDRDHSHSHEHAVHDWAVGSWSAHVDTPATWVGIAAWWNLLANKFGDDLLRCKGLLHIAEGNQFVRIQGVGKVFHSPEKLAAWPDLDDPRSRVVCIGMNLDAGWLDASLRALSLTDPSSRPLTLDDLAHCN